MLAQVSRQVLDHLVKLKEFPDSRIIQIQTCATKLTLGGIVWIFPLPCMNKPGESRKCFFVKIQNLPDFTRRRTPAICDDIRGHGRTEFSVTRVNVLNGFFALISARQIEVDIGPLASLFGKKSLKQQLHADRIDGRDSE